MRVVDIINDAVLRRFNLRITRASTWSQLQRREALAASTIAGERILTLGSLLVPQQIVGHSKVRVGSRYDGGYVCVNDFEGINTALSLGIGYNDDWDVAIAERGIVVHQFDHSIDEPPHVHQNCRFTKKKIVSRDDGTPNVETLGRLVDEHGYKKGSSLVLKMDVENDEWQIFAEMTAEHLAKFSQIICGFHLFSSVVGDGAYQRALHVLEKLDRGFGVVHVHGNNFAPWINLGGVPFPELLEVTYANRLRYKFNTNQEVFPTVLDAPNDPRKPDMFLSRFHFHRAMRPELAANAFTYEDQQHRARHDQRTTYERLKAADPNGPDALR